MRTPTKRAQTPSSLDVKKGALKSSSPGTGTVLQSSVWLKEFESGKDAPEMPRSHKGLVDTCFEEAHYESGIQVLDRLRSSTYIPTISHVRQLLYIALYPPPPPPPSIDQNIHDSPRKLHAKRQRLLLMPSADASIRATALLIAFMHTNGPSSIFRAIPSYGVPNTGKGGVRFKDVADVDEDINRDMEDSPLGKGARALGQVKDCWGLLEPELVKSKGQRGSGENSSSDDEECKSDDMNLGFESKAVKRIVGKHSWGMLEVLVQGFEEDERRMREKNEDAPYVASQVLLTQVPHVQAGQPWNVERPVNVVFAALSPPASAATPKAARSKQAICIDPYRAQLGTRLLKLLINATHANSGINPASLIRFSLTHIQKTSFPPESLQFLLDSLMVGDDYLPFVISLLGHFLGTEVEESTKGKAAAGTRLRPAPSAKPRTRRSSRRSARSSSSGLSSPPPISPVKPAQRSTSFATGNSSSPYPLPTLHTFILHLSSLISVPTSARIPPVDIVDITKVIIAKTCILVAFNRVHNTSSKFGVGSGAEEKANEWRDALQQGTVSQSLTSCFERHMQKLKSTGTQIPALIGALYDIAGDMADIVSVTDGDVIID